MGCTPGQRKSVPEAGGLAGTTMVVSMPMNSCAVLVTMRMAPLPVTRGAAAEESLATPTVPASQSSAAPVKVPASGPASAAVSEPEVPPQAINEQQSNAQ
jgi:hypothetical protein